LLFYKSSYNSLTDCFSLQKSKLRKDKYLIIIIENPCNPCQNILHNICEISKISVLIILIQIEEIAQLVPQNQKCNSFATAIV
jgi:hypothetical protein